MIQPCYTKCCQLLNGELVPGGGLHGCELRVDFRNAFTGCTQRCDEGHFAYVDNQEEPTFVILGARDRWHPDVPSCVKDCCHKYGGKYGDRDNNITCGWDKAPPGAMAGYAACRDACWPGPHKRQATEHSRFWFVRTDN